MLVLGAGIFLSGCLENNTPQNLDKNYFDLKEYFVKKGRLLTKQNTSIEKILITNRDTQRVYLQNVNWEVELLPFINSDINKPAWKNSYRIDSVFNASSLTSISYTSLEDLEIKHLQIHFSDNKVQHIFIESAVNNYIYNSAQVLSYSTDKGYSIEGEQDVIIGKDLHYKIDVNFIK